MNLIISVFNHFRETAAKGIYIFLSNILEKATFFVLFVLLARGFAIEMYGMIVASFAAANIIISIFESGYNFYLQRAVAAKDALISKTSNQIFTLRIYLLIPYLLLSFGYYHFSNIHLPIVYVLIILTIFIFSVNNLCNSIFFGSGRFKTSFLLLFLSRITLSTLFIIFLLLHTRIEIMVLAFFVGALVHFILLYSNLRKTGFRLSIVKPDAELLKKISVSALPMGIGMILVWLYDRADTLMIQSILSTKAVAIYAAAYSIYKAPQALSGFLLTPLFTEYSTFFARNKYIQKENFFNKFIILLFIGITFSSVIYFFSQAIIVFLYKEYYELSVPFLKVLVFALPGLLFNNLTGTTLNAANKEKYVTIAVFISALLNLSLNITLMVKLKSIFVACYLTVLTEYISFFLQAAFIIKLRIFSKPQVIR